MTHTVFGRTKDGRTVTAYCLRNRRGATAVILDYGCTVQSLCVPNAQGGMTDVVLGYETVTEYEENGGYLGAAIGRMANRIGKSEFILNGTTYRLASNDGANHLHGGIIGFDKVIWNADRKGNALVLTRVSPDGEESYPGNLAVTITYVLTENNALQITYDAISDADTIVNLTNHSYFNLNGKGSVLGHYLQVFAAQLTENDKYCLPTGKLLCTAETPFDFSKPKQLGQDIEAPDVQLVNGDGYDHNFVLPDNDAVGDKTRLRKAAVLFGPDTKISMTTFTTLPGIQVYSGNSLTPRKGKNGSQINRRDAICLETQVYPDAMANAHFPSPILRANEPYQTQTIYHFEIH